MKKNSTRTITPLSSSSSLFPSVESSQRLRRQKQQHHQVDNMYNDDKIIIKESIHEQLQNSWCPFAKQSCDGSSSSSTTHSSLCRNNPCQQRYLLILATGRDGSTSMRQLVNMLPNIRLGGENDNAFGKIYQFLFHNSSLHQQDDSSASTLFSSDLKLNSPGNNFDGSWGHYPISMNDMICVFQTILNSINPPPPPLTKQEEDDTFVVKGFKELWFHLRQTNETAKGFVDKIQHVLPCSRIIINYNSNIQIQMESQIQLGWFRNSTSEEQQGALNELIDSQHNLLEIATLMGSQQVYVFDSSVYKQNQTMALQQINHMVQWLGYENCIFKQLVHANANRSYEVKPQRLDLGPNCHYSGMHLMQS